jgi:hypothetical protein
MVRGLPDEIEGNGNLEICLAGTQDDFAFPGIAGSGHMGKIWEGFFKARDTGTNQDEIWGSVRLHQ